MRQFATKKLTQRINKIFTIILVNLLMMNSGINIILAQETTAVSEPEVVDITLPPEPVTEAPVVPEETEPVTEYVEPTVPAEEVVDQAETVEQVTTEEATTDTTEPRTESTTETTTMTTQTQAFNHYLTGVKVEQNNQVISEVKDLSSVKITFNYQLNDSPEVIQHTKYEYQLPKGLIIESQQNGQVIANGVIVGQFVLEKNGKITFTFNKEGAGQVGSFSLVAKVSNDASGQVEKIQFEQLFTLAIILPKDIKVEKQAKMNPDKMQIDYQVKVSSSKGSGETITLTDQLSYDNNQLKSQFLINQFKLIKVSANGQETSVALNSNNFIIDQSNNYFQIKALPALAKTEYYLLKYSVNYQYVHEENDQHSLNNQIQAVSGEMHEKAHVSFTWNKAIVKKATFDETTKVIKWEILINSEHKKVNGWRISESIPVPLNGKIILTNLTNGSQQEIKTNKSKLDYQFSNNLTDDDAKARYTITYQTKVEDGVNQYKTETTLINNHGQKLKEVYPFRFELTKTTGQTTELETTTETTMGNYSLEEVIISSEEETFESEISTDEEHTVIIDDETNFESTTDLDSDKGSQSENENYSDLEEYFSEFAIQNSLMRSLPLPQLLMAESILNDLSGIASKHELMDTMTMSRTANSGSFDLTERITRVVVTVNGQVQSEINDGDKATIIINYSLAPDDISASQPVVHYQLPKDFKILTEQVGKVFDGTTEVGNYIITQDGMVTITFNESDIESGVGRDGTIRFLAKASAEEIDEGGTVQFPGDSQPVKIKKPVVDNSDIQTVKKGTLNQTEDRIDYEIIVSTTNGTNSTVSIKDGFTWSNNIDSLAYDKENLKVVKVSADGSQTIVNLSEYKVNWQDGQNANFNINDLPKLDANEKYIVTYFANIKANSNGKSFSVNNWASSSSNPKTSEDVNNITWHKNATKTGRYDQNTGLITWEIIINQNRKDISGYNFKDLIPGTLVGDVTLTNNSFWSESTIPVTNNQLDYTFPKNLPDNEKTSQYTIRYQTKPTVGSKQEKNVVEMTPPNGDTVKDEAIVDITQREKSLEKSFQSSSITGTIMTNNWRTHITLSEGNLSNIFYEDVIQNGRDENGKDLGPNTHFAYASELEADLINNLTIQIDNNNQYRYNGVDKDPLKNSIPTNEITFEVNYYDANGNPVDSTDSSTKVQRYTVEVLPRDGVKLEARNFMINNYRTHTDISTIKINGSITSVNTAVYEDLTKEASTTYIKKSDFVKEQRIGTSVFYDNNSTTIDLDESNGILEYRLRLKTSASHHNGDIVITDTLPEGASLVPESVKGRFYSGDYWMPTNNYKGFDFDDGQNPSYSVSGNQLTITIKDYRFDESLPTVAILYQLDIKNDPNWKDIQTTKKKYTNKAQWGSSTVTHETEVHRTIKKLSKSGQQLDINGNPVQLNSDGTLANDVVPSNQIKYTVEINPQGLDLNLGSDYLTLTDKLSGGEGYSPTLDLNSLKLYRYDETKKDHKGILVSENNYSFKYNTDTNQFEIAIPDGKGFVLEYVYNLDPNYQNNTVISNNVNLMGEWQSNNQTTMKISESGATSTQRHIKVYKVDEDNFKKTLDGTKFRLEYYDKNETNWKTKTENVVVNSEGFILWNLSGVNKSIDSDILYRLVETKPLEGYSMPEKPTYFLWVGSHENVTKAKEDAGLSQSGIDEKDIKIFGYSGGITYISNKYTRVTAHKTWEDINGNILINPPSSVNVTLYQQKQQTDGYKVTVISQTSASWINTTERTKIIGTVYVNKNTARGLTIGVNDNQYSSYTVNGVTNTLTPDYIMKVNIGSITSDMTVILNTNNNHTHGVEFSNYDRAGTVLVDRKVYDETTLNSSNNWSYHWDGLPATDEDGNPLYYTIEEEPIPGYSTTYVNNNGIQSGTINIINTAIEPPKPIEYQLPITGGMGTTTLYWIGGMLLVLAISISYYQHSRTKQ
ncbi:Cna B-type domain-containing protein [Globicatella sulfidifaciens]|uniref:Cna B-type domain-containing protein n=1 Tax=Globicatella sulfidifaciens TaxID=136093 RepID=A0A7X8H055_9LACT|nr:Cna B-type domain-containing protein [Globicatella sulfidifaciens]NLJ18252.1 Cna B-type domain-containing protein [Globicatella sulfidifaciens]